jgi:hypothetical protein
MKKLILIFTLLALLLNSNAQLKPLKGYYAKITKDSLITPSTVLYTNFWVEIDSIQQVNNVRIGWDQVITYTTISFKIYKGYYYYRNWFSNIYYPVSSFSIQNIDIIDGWYLETWMPAVLKTNLATIFQVAESAVTIYSYY